MALNSVSTQVQKIKIDEIQKTGQAAVDETTEIAGQLFLMARVLLDVELDRDELGNISDMMNSWGRRLNDAGTTAERAICDAAFMVRSE